MSHPASSIENELQNLRAAPLDEALLERLEACVDGSWTRLDPTEQAFEKHLRSFTPAKLPPSLNARLENLLGETPFIADPRIVAFPKAPKPAQRQTRPYHRFAVAAAVAIMGASAALLVPPTDKRQAAAPPANPGAGLANRAGTTPPNAAHSRLVPAGFNRNLSEASDQGLIWRDDNLPHRVLKFVYNERVTTQDAAGRTFEVEQPRVEYIIVPAKVD
jgi:hypothetical protein